MPSLTFQRTMGTLALAAATLLAHAQDDPVSLPDLNVSNTIRGTITSATPNAFSLRTDDGILYKVLYSVNSRVFMDRGPAKVADIHTGDMLIASGNLDDSAHTIGAAILIGIGADEVRKAREGLGKTWTAGRITNVSIGDSPTITVARLDGVSQKFTVDETTSFKHRRDSITMADIKPGDNLRAEGHLSGKLFLATEIHVFNPAERGGDFEFAGPASGHPNSPRHRPTSGSQNGTAQP